MAISREAVEGLAPDAALLKAAQKLASGRKLSGLGREGELAWGEVAGSAAVPYHVAFDARESLSFKCTCPSRKSPCKHALALAVRFAEKPDGFASGEAVEKPSWVSDWERSLARKAARAAGAGKPVDAAAQAKRAAAREQKVAGGLSELEMWLRDLMRGGIAGLPAQPYEFWDKIAARMVDAQCKGLARRLREMAGVPHSGAGWQEEMLRQLGLLHLIIEGYKRLDSLSPQRQADIRSLIGWDVGQSDLLQNGTPLRDRWLALSFSREESDDGLISGRTWLWGQSTNRPALILQFERAGWGSDEGLAPAAPPGTSFDGGLVFFPGSSGLRALVKEKLGPPQPAGFSPGGTSTVQVLEAWALALSRFPWLESWPCALNGVVPIRSGGRLWAHDEAGALEMSTRRVDEWALLAASGGRELSLFGLWNGRAFEPLATLWGEPRATVTPLPAAEPSPRSSDIPF